MTRTGAWITLAAMSAVFFLITAATFTSLGVVLPAMVGDLGWSWSEAGFGFSLLGVFCGVTSTIPATLIRRIGVRVTLLCGAAVMALAFLCLARTHGPLVYFVGASIAGLGFSLLATVPGTYLLARCFARPSFAFGLYFTIGGLGGVAGPLAFFAVRALTGDWRDYWLVAGAAVAASAILAALVIDVGTDLGIAAAQSPNGEIKVETPLHEQAGWSVAAALRTPQFAVLAAAYTAFLFCGITANSISVAHLMDHGIAAAVAGGMLSLESLLNALARAGGGLAAGRIKPKRLLVLALGALITGLAALAFARGWPLMIVYAAGIGIGYGLTFFASTILLLEYFGRVPNLELFSLVNLISTAASVGPFLAGWTRDASGSFAPFLLVLAGGVFLLLLAVLRMVPPRRAG